MFIICVDLLNTEKLKMMAYCHIKKEIFSQIILVNYYCHDSICSLFQEANVYFKDAQASLGENNEKIDEQLEPLEPAVCGSVARSTDDVIDKYRHLGMLNRQVCKLRYVK